LYSSIINGPNFHIFIVMYIEACESGSLFEDYLPPDRHILAVTAANATEPSYACCYDPEIGAYLGDAFSVR
jgi:legumain